MQQEEDSTNDKQKYNPKTPHPKMPIPQNSAIAARQLSKRGTRTTGDAFVGLADLLKR